MPCLSTKYYECEVTECTPHPKVVVCRYFKGKRKALSDLAGRYVVLPEPESPPKNANSPRLVLDKSKSEFFIDLL